MNKKELEIIEKNWEDIKPLLQKEGYLPKAKHDQSMLVTSKRLNISVLMYDKNEDSIKTHFLHYVRDYYPNKFSDIKDINEVDIQYTPYLSSEIVRDYTGDGESEWNYNMHIHPKFMIKNSSKWNKLACCIIQEQADRLHPERKIQVYRPDKRKNSRVTA